MKYVICVLVEDLIRKKYFTQFTYIELERIFFSPVFIWWYYSRRRLKTSSPQLQVNLKKSWIINFFIECYLFQIIQNINSKFAKRTFRIQTRLFYCLHVYSFSIEKMTITQYTQIQIVNITFEILKYFSVK